ncbi:MAG: choice-of-anchor Q domain-containing protein [Ignavibacteriaceae bacterium]|nr:choice-of-anchor Q domain-containing protein [Ignavibacteriaceae bacterium]
MRTIFVTLLFIINTAFATTYYIDSINGNDKNPGITTSSPWNTLHKINIFKFKTGDTVSLMSGSRFMITEPISSKSGIIFNSYGAGERPVIDAGSSCICVNFDGANDTKFINCKFVNGFPNNINLWKCNHITIESCNIDSSKGANIHNCNIYTGEGSFLSVRNSTLNYSEQTQGTGNLGIYLDGTENSLMEYDTLMGNFSNIRIGFGNAPTYDYTDNLVVRYCVVKYGKYDNIDDDGSRNAQFYYNVFESDTSSGYHDNVYIFSDGSGKFDQYSAVGSKYFNNTFISHSKGCTFEIRNGVVATNNTIKNNIFYNTNPSGWMFYSDNTYGTWEFNNNIFYITHGTYNHYWHINSTTIANFKSWKNLGYDTLSICADPLFTNYRTGNYSLRSGSPALNSGTSVGLTNDIHGNPVPKNSTDIGAFQHFNLE